MTRICPRPVTDLVPRRFHSKSDCLNRLARAKRAPGNLDTRTAVRPYCGWLSGRADNQRRSTHGNWPDRAERGE
jgi:hypothetical protein